MPNTLTTTPELVTPGQPSAATLAQLKAAGDGLDIFRISAAVLRVESQRANFMAEAIRLGVLLLAKKESLGHGQFQKLAAQVWEANGTRVSHFSSLHNFTRNLRRYCLLAQHFLADLEQGSFLADVKDMAVKAPEVTTQDLLAVDFANANPEVYNRIEQFVGGRSLRRMLLDFSRAEKAADREEQAETEAAAKRGTKAAGSAAVQLDFWDEINRPLTELGTLMKSPDFIERTTREGWLKLAAELTARARDAKALADRTR